MATFLVKLLAKKEMAEKTTAFFFEKPKGFKFIPGQFIEITLKKETYPFSISSSPKEKELFITTRMRPSSAFKNKLKKLKVGTKVKIEGPFGQFTLHKNSKTPAVFLAGGIGITPFRSMLETYPNRKIALFYSNRRKKDAPFLEELKKLENKNFKLVATMTKESGEHISPKMLKENVKNWRKPIYYAVGSAGFVQSMAGIFAKMKIKSEQIKTENFSGY